MLFRKKHILTPYQSLIDEDGDPERLTSLVGKRKSRDYMECAN